MEHSMKRTTEELDQLKEECGVFGMFDFDGGDVASSIYYGLFALQHRGQESCGIAVSDTQGAKGNIESKKGMGLCNEVFTPEDLAALKGDIGVGHVRYSTAGESCIENAQPLVLNYVKGTLGLVHNGNLINAKQLRHELEYDGAIFQTTIDSEVIAYHIARERLNAHKAEIAVKNAMQKIRGAYALVVNSPRKMIGARDPFGLKPLCIGKKDNTYFLASESCAIAAVDAEFIRDVRPGEIVTITKNGIESDNLHRYRRSGGFDLFARIVCHGPNTAYRRSDNDGIARMERAVLNQNCRHRSAAAVKLRLNDNSFRATVRIGFEFLHLRDKKNHFQQLRQSFFRESGHRHANRITAPFFRNQVVFCQLLLDIFRIGAGLVDFIDRHDDRNSCRLCMIDSFHRLRHDTVIRSNDKNGDIR